MKAFGNRLLGMTLLSLLIQAAHGARWTHEESLMISEAYTDNVRLTEDDREGRWATIISPNFTINGEGRRIRLSAAGALQFISNSAQTFYPVLRAQASAELVKRHFFIDANASASQITVNPLRPAGSPINDTGNITTNYHLSINPYFVTRLDDAADLRLDYRLGHDFYVGKEINDRSTHDFRFSLTDSVGFGPLSWGLLGDYSKTYYDSDNRTDTTRRSLQARLGYSLDRTLSAYASVGREWNQYTGSTTRNGGEVWQVGMIWQPNPRFSLDLGYGYRFFGHHPTVAISYRHRHSTFKLRYKEDLESGYYNGDIGGILADQDIAGHPQDPFGGGQLDGGGRARIADAALEGANVNRMLRGDYLLTGKRSRLSITASYSFRTWEARPDELRELELYARFDRRLAKNFSLDLGLGWSRTEDETDFRADTWDARVAVNRKLGRYTTLRFSYTHAQRDSNRPDDDYRENRVALVLNTSLRKLLRQAGIRP